jgi:hypothetical protein
MALSPESQPASQGSPPPTRVNRRASRFAVSWAWCGDRGLLARGEVVLAGAAHRILSIRDRALLSYPVRILVVIAFSVAIYLWAMRAKLPRNEMLLLVNRQAEHGVASVGALAPGSP